MLVMYMYINNFIIKHIFNKNTLTKINNCIILRKIKLAKQYEHSS